MLNREINIKFKLNYYLLVIGTLSNFQFHFEVLLSFKIELCVNMHVHLLSDQTSFQNVIGFHFPLYQFLLYSTQTSGINNGAVGIYDVVSLEIKK